MALAPEQARIGIRRHFTTEGVHPYDELAWEQRDARITNFRDGTEFIDLKLSYQFDEHWNVYVSGRNVTRELTYRTIQPNNTYSDGAPTLEQMSYGGARWQFGLSWQY